MKKIVMSCTLLLLNAESSAYKGQKCVDQTILCAIRGLQSTETQILEKVCEILIKVCSIQDCAPTPITESTTIFESGSYCLANDITGQIIITANNVSLDLNHYSITNTTGNAIVGANLTGISIFNGTVIGGATTGGGISLTGPSEEIRLRDINFRNGATGLTLDANNFVVDPMLFLNQATSAMVISGNGGFFKDVQIEGFTGNIAVDINNASNMLFDHVRIANSANASSPSTLSGFRVQNAESLIFQECSVENANAIDTFIGFDLQATSTCLELIECIANHNQAAGSGSSGFHTAGNDIHMRNNTALCNTNVVGFLNEANTTNVYLNNRSQANSNGNYSGIGATIIVGFTTAGGGSFSATPGPFDNISVN